MACHLEMLVKAWPWLRLTAHDGRDGVDRNHFLQSRERARSTVDLVVYTLDDPDSLVPSPGDCALVWNPVKHHDEAVSYASIPSRSSFECIQCRSGTLQQSG